MRIITDRLLLTNRRHCETAHVYRHHSQPQSKLPNILILIHNSLYTISLTIFTVLTYMYLCPLRLYIVLFLQEGILLKDDNMFKTINGICFTVRKAYFIFFYFIPAYFIFFFFFFFFSALGFKNCSDFSSSLKW